MFKLLKNKLGKVFTVLLIVSIVSTTSISVVTANDIDVMEKFQDEVLRNIGAGNMDILLHTKDDNIRGLRPFFVGTYFDSIFNGARIYYTITNDVVTKIRFDVKTHLDDFDEDLLYETVRDILDIIIKPGSSDEEKIIAMVDWISSNIEYGNSEADKVSPHSVFRLISHQEGYCQVYASLFQLMADMENLDSVYLTGLSGDNLQGGLHGWNMVKLNGKWVGVDATWHVEGEPHFYTDLNEFGLMRELPDDLDNTLDDLLENVKTLRKYDKKI